MEKARLTLKFSQEIRTETRISHFNLNKGDLVGKIYVCIIFVNMFTTVFVISGFN